MLQVMKKYLYYIFAILFFSTLINYDRESRTDFKVSEKLSQPFDSSLFTKADLNFNGLQIGPFFGIGSREEYTNLILPLWQIDFASTAYRKKNNDSIFISIDNYQKPDWVIPSMMYRTEQENEIIFLFKKNSWFILFFFYSVIILSIVLHLIVLRIIIRIADDILNDEPFSNKILTRLKFCYTVSFFYPVINTLLSYVTGRLLQDSNIDIASFNFWQSFTTARGYWFFAFACFCLFHAFKKGFLLKQEQSLTI